MNDHTVKAFDEDIGQLRGLIAQMGGLAEHAIAAAMEAPRRHALEGAREIVPGDKRIAPLPMGAQQPAVPVIPLPAPLPAAPR